MVCLVRDWVPSSPVCTLQNSCTLVHGSVEDQEAMERIIGEYEIEVVFHLAAQTIVGIANRNPVSTFESNIKGTWCVLEACKRSPKVKSIVVASSDKAYGAQPVLPYTEEMPLLAKHPYDVSKACTDLIAQSYAYTFGLPVAISRCGNFFGEGDLNWNRIVPGTIRSILRNEDIVIRSDGKMIRDYFYTTDGANAYITLAKALYENTTLSGEAFNFSTDMPMTVLDMVELIKKTMKVDTPCIMLNQASNEIPEQHLLSAKARKMLNWKPEFTIEQGLEKTVRWYSNLLQ